MIIITVSTIPSDETDSVFDHHDETDSGIHNMAESSVPDWLRNVTTHIFILILDFNIHVHVTG